MHMLILFQLHAVGEFSEYQPNTMIWFHKKETQVQKLKWPCRPFWPSPGVDTLGPRNTELTMRAFQGRHTADFIQLKSVKVVSSALGQCYNMKDNTSDCLHFKATNTSLYCWDILNHFWRWFVSQGNCLTRCRCSYKSASFGDAP